MWRRRPFVPFILNHCLCKIMQSRSGFEFFKQMRRHSGSHLKNPSQNTWFHYRNKLEISHHLKYDPNIYLQIGNTH